MTKSLRFLLSELFPLVQATVGRGASEVVLSYANVASHASAFDKWPNEVSQRKHGFRIQLYYLMRRNMY